VHENGEAWKQVSTISRHTFFVHKTKHRLSGSEQAPWNTISQPFLDPCCSVLASETWFFAKIKACLLISTVFLQTKEPVEGWMGCPPPPIKKGSMPPLVLLGMCTTRCENRCPLNSTSTYLLLVVPPSNLGWHWVELHSFPGCCYWPSFLSLLPGGSFWSLGWFWATTSYDQKILWGCVCVCVCVW
jgi:hypothetical protein